MPCTKERTIELYNKYHVKFLEPLGKQVKLSFNRDKTRAGVCFYNPLEIKISEYYLNSKIVTENDVSNTLLHEIAHAISGHEAGHGPKWKKVAKSIGCDGKRCTKAFLQANEYKYTLKCNLGCVIKRHKLKRNKLYVCSKHRKVLSQ